jgi:hypothetical protein
MANVLMGLIKMRMVTAFHNMTNVQRDFIAMKTMKPVDVSQIEYLVKKALFETPTFQHVQVNNPSAVTIQR